MATQGFQQVQKLTQNLVLAPQLRQSLKILQVPTMELRNVILEELQTNPTLEEMPMDSMSLEGNEAANNNGEVSNEGSSGEELDFSENLQAIQRLEEDWKQYFAEENGNQVYTSDDAERRQHFFDSLTSDTSLQEHLLRQAELTEASAEVLKALEYLIGSLDDRGFLNGALPDLAMLAEVPLKAMQDAHALLQTLDPPGIGAADLAECLFLQLKQLGRGRSLAATLVKDHFKLLLRRRIPELSRKLGVSADEVHMAVEEIATLDPAPGRRFSEDNNRIVVPDVKVEKDNGEWIIHLNSDYIPRLRISQTYKEMIAKGKLSKKEKDYVQDKFRSGRFLMSSIEQRQQTIERITRQLLHFQEAFFEKGVSGLRPLTMNQVAEVVGVHETTVSRAIANKYIETPHGVFDFKYFFTPGYKTQEGNAVSNTSVKDLIAHIIEGENPAKPYSDQEVVRILGEKEIKIARRTVAKYREELGILPTNLRRQYS